MWHWGCCDLCPVSAVLIALCYANQKLGLITLSQTVRETKYPVTSGYLLGHSSFSFGSCNDLISTLRVLLLVLIRLRKSSACCRCATCTIWSRISIFCSSFVKPNCGKLACTCVEDRLQEAARYSGTQEIPHLHTGLSNVVPVWPCDYLSTKIWRLWGSVFVAPRILNVNTGRIWIVTLIPRPV